MATKLERMAGSKHRFLLNMGPQHPSTHGVLRVVLEMDGEYAMELDPVLGYGHRMHEKMAEVRPTSGFYPNTARMDYLGAILFSHGYVGLLERMAGVEVPERAEYIRVITAELNRISSHLVGIGAYVLDLGAFTPILYAFDDREKILDILEAITGSRLTYCYFRAGGVSRDIDDTFIRRTREFIDRMRNRMPMYHDLVTDNIIFLKRTKEIGLIDRDMAIRYGLTGPVLRGSGIAYDVRKSEPYSIYDRFDFEIPTGENGDSFDRYLVRMEEIVQSLRIIEQALDALPDGPVMAKTKKIKLPAGECNYTVEAARGSLSYYLVGDGSDTPYRLKIRVPSYANLSPLPELCRGILLSDLVTAMGSLDLVIPEIDR
ncbi:NADH-quinone oxidoreductase subunit D [Desulfoluna sp.]|uniref:NADH-quinone oxidoreductase subunit D n=1 Tax=Desulfoluna sp. TaxID=2045199 RepID=UPI002620790F|nr:NADH-quinone oxidoreductase subunit D [Desulfoluna sp.]